jgi:hypothetical protein
MDSWFCPLSTDFGNVADWIQGIAAIGGVVAVVWVWIRQANLTRESNVENARLAREAQRHSLMPHLWVTRVVAVEGDPHLLVTIKNDGLGPAIVKSVAFQLDEIPFEDGPDDVMYRLKDAVFPVPEGSRAIYGGGTAPDVGEWIQSGAALPLLELTFCDEVLRDEYMKSGSKEVIAACARIQIEILYESVFGEKFSVNSAL